MSEQFGFGTATSAALVTGASTAAMPTIVSTQGLVNMARFGIMIALPALQRQRRSPHHRAVIGEVARSLFD
jgi:hypothetical protein